ncbi:MAG: TolB family protein, partial [Candidatus Humimicrobiaceae bacterium]
IALVVEEKSYERQTTLTKDPAADDSDPFWSPDGKMISFQSDRDGNGEIYVMNADGTGQINLTKDPAADDGEPFWSPDGKMIAFNSNRDGNWEIYVMNADASGKKRLTGVK